MKISSESPFQPSDSHLRFQQAREAAQQKMKNLGSRQRLEDLIRVKKKGQEPQTVKEDGGVMGKGMSEVMRQTFLKAGEFLMYCKDSRATTPKSFGRILGNYVDKMA